MDSTQKWLHFFKITGDQHQQWISTADMSCSLIHSILLSGGIDEAAYLDWASHEYRLPFLKSEFFAHNFYQPDFAQFAWRKDLFPVGKWEGHLIVACHEPAAISVAMPVIYVLAQAMDLDKTWLRFRRNEMPQASIQATSSPPPPPPPPLAMREPLLETLPEPPAFEAPSPLQAVDAPPPFELNRQPEPEFTTEAEGSEASEQGQPEPVGEPLGLNFNADFKVDFGSLFSTGNSAPSEELSPPPPPPAAPKSSDLHEPTAVATVEALPFTPPPPPAFAPTTEIPEAPAVSTLDFPMPPPMPTELYQSSPLTEASETEESLSATQIFDLEEVTKLRHLHQTPAETEETMVNLTQVFKDVYVCQSYTLEDVQKSLSNMNQARTMDEVLGAAFGLMQQYFQKSMFLAYHKNSLIPIRWTANWSLHPGATPVPLITSEPSPFRVAAQTGFPYHGYVQESRPLKEFLNTWNMSHLPNHLSVFQLKIQSKTVGYLLGLEINEGAVNKNVYRFMEELSQRVSDKLQKLESQAA